MKHIRIVFLFLIGSNILFSQQRTAELPIENQRLVAQEDAVFKFHPNPAEDDLFIIGTLKIKRVEIIDVLGKRVALHQFNKSIIRMNISELKSGIYLLKVTDKNKKQSIKKLIVK